MATITLDALISLNRAYDPVSTSKCISMSFVAIQEILQVPRILPGAVGPAISFLFKMLEFEKFAATALTETPVRSSFASSKRSILSIITS